MKNPYALIFFGFISILMGIGDDKTNFIPAEFKFMFGAFLILYGAYLIYRQKLSNDKKEKEVTYLKRTSFLYLALGFFLVKSPRIIIPDYAYDLNLLTILLYTFGFGFLIYGLKLFFKEKREKNESGSIE